MAEANDIRTSRHEAVQPSLWDRLVDDMPGLVAETEGMRAELARILGGVAEVDALVSGGPRAIEKRIDLSEKTRLLLHRLQQKLSHRMRLEDRGVVVSADVLREAVRRDIEMLFNVERLEADFLMTERESLSVETPAAKLERFPEIRRSVLNYGVPSFAGRMSGNDFDKDALAREIREVLQVYEPRLRKESIKVKVRVGDKTGMRIDVDGVLMLSPVPERLRLSTTVDLDNGQARTQLEDM
ncbi:type VI secretion system baseplate subunit TssE [Ruegeria aquimaris]|uniref:Type VI secretion system baseplate subunit TssE n=1 Tax=Ruegeria aquimaris TaxID=2984333 RepID=A0ABT3ANR4_9RHOB|nr:type VI secretion system baseplate subunit TssE [Ruegeria sp. XHP0148]MCV2890320.1 type VI secretion system baseplate subunit TssE [Ruegeria sp. XHP0148]